MVGAGVGKGAGVLAGSADEARSGGSAAMPAADQLLVARTLEKLGSFSHKFIHIRITKFFINFIK